MVETATVRLNREILPIFLNTGSSFKFKLSMNTLHPKAISLRLVIFLINTALLLACGTASRTEEKPEAKNDSLYKCYGSYTDKDSVFLKIIYEGDRVNGDIVYKLFEKDKNVGNFEGTLHGDTVFAVYNFLSEGRTSTREVAFLKKGDTLIEGFGPMDASGTRFKNKGELDFAGIVLQAEGCRD